MSQAFVALGSNLQQPHDQVKRAMDELAALPQTRLAKASSLYRTVALGVANQPHPEFPDFINAVAELDTGLAAQDLLAALLAIEAQHGRERPFANAPRVLDLDLLLYDELVLDTPTLTLPHPRMHERGFVMLPLAEIAPQRRVGQHGTASALAAACADQGVQRLQAES